MNRLALLLLLAPACINFDELESEACARRGVCDPALMVSDAGAGTTDAGASPFCQPCTTSAECGGPSNLCLVRGSSSFCGVACTPGSCGAGQRCVEFTIQGTSVFNCAPVPERLCDGGLADGG